MIKFTDRQFNILNINYPTSSTREKAMSVLNFVAHYQGELETAPYTTSKLAKLYVENRTGSHTMGTAYFKRLMKDMYELGLLRRAIAGNKFYYGVIKDSDKDVITCQTLNKTNGLKTITKLNELQNIESLQPVDNSKKDSSKSSAVSEIVYRIVSEFVSDLVVKFELPMEQVISMAKEHFKDPKIGDFLHKYINNNNNNNNIDIDIDKSENAVETDTTNLDFEYLSEGTDDKYKDMGNGNYELQWIEIVELANDLMGQAGITTDTNISLYSKVIDQLYQYHHEKSKINRFGAINFIQKTIEANAVILNNVVASIKYSKTQVTKSAEQSQWERLNNIATKGLEERLQQEQEVVSGTLIYNNFEDDFNFFG